MQGINEYLPTSYESCHFKGQMSPCKEPYEFYTVGTSRNQRTTPESLKALAITVLEQSAIDFQSSVSAFGGKLVIPHLFALRHQRKAPTEAADWLPRH